MHCAGHTSPTLSGIAPAAIIAYFSGTPPPQIPATVFCGFPPALPQPYRPFCRWPMPPISVGGFDNPHRSAVSVAGFRCCFRRRQIPAAFTVARLGFRGFSSLRAFITEPPPNFHRFPWGNEGAMMPRRSPAPLLGRRGFLSVIDEFAPYETSFLTKPHGSKLSLSSFCGYRMAPGSRSVVCGSD